MAQSDRQIGQQENESLLKSRVFKGGLVLAIAGLVASSAALLTIGFGAMGGAWAMKGGK